VQRAQIEIEGARGLANALSDGAAPQLLSLNMRQACCPYHCESRSPERVLLQNAILSEGCTELCRALEAPTSRTAHPTDTAQPMEGRSMALVGSLYRWA